MQASPDQTRPDQWTGPSQSNGWGEPTIPHQSTGPPSESTGPPNSTGPSQSTGPPSQLVPQDNWSPHLNGPPSWFFLVLAVSLWFLLVLLNFSWFLIFFFVLFVSSLFLFVFLVISWKFILYAHGLSTIGGKANGKRAHVWPLTILPLYLIQSFFLSCLNWSA